MAPEVLTPGAILQDTYRIVRRIGRGGMGEVYEATHARLAGRYAVKLLLGEISAQPEAFARFRREAEVTSSLRHPNIVQVIDFNHTAGGVPYLVMEFLEGAELSRELAQQDGPLPLARVQAILRQAVSALTAAHNRGIVHRDLKPDNLFLAQVDGEDHEVVKILDFGISKVKQATTKLTRESAVFGTAHYMSPEQALGQGDAIDARSDQFSLGSITYQMLTGREPFQGDSVPAVVYQVVHTEPQPLELANPSLRPELAAVVRRAMAKEKDQRYPNVRDFFNAFAAATGLRGEQLLAPPMVARSNVEGLPPAEGPRSEVRATPIAVAAVPSSARTTMGASTGELAGAGAGPAARAPRRRGVMVSAAVGLMAVGVAAAFVAREPRPPAPEPRVSAGPPPVSAPVTPPPAATLPPAAPPAPAISAEAAEPAPPPRDDSPAVSPPP